MHFHRLYSSWFTLWSHPRSFLHESSGQKKFPMKNKLINKSIKSWRKSWYKKKKKKKKKSTKMPKRRVNLNGTLATKVQRLNKFFTLWVRGFNSPLGDFWQIDLQMGCARRHSRVTYFCIHNGDTSKQDIMYEFFVVLATSDFFKSLTQRNKLNRFSTELGVSIRHSHDPHKTKNE